MRCPLDQTQMREMNRRGVQIDVCPECRGVWLDGGELEKMLASAEQWEDEEYRRRERRDDDDDFDDDYERRSGGRRKRRGILGDLFDFG
jgi:uncharacterized protein